MSAVLEFGFNAAPVFSGVDAMERRVKSADAAIIASQKKLEAAMKNPWVSAGIQQKKYFDQLVTTERQTRQIAAAHARLATYTGPKAAPGMSPWGSAGAGQWAEAKRMEESIRAQNAAITAQEERIRARNAALDAWRPRGGETFDTNRMLYQQAQAQMAARSAQGRAGGRGMALGGAAMQVQDIAIQLQMGTRLSTVIAQQGSQMLSVFGAGGAVFGGLVAVGGAFVTMGQKARESLDATISGAKELRGEMDLLAQGGSIDAVSAKLSQIGVSGAAAFKELNGFNTLKGGLWTEILAIFGGPTGTEKFTANMQAITAGQEARQRLQQRMLDLSAQENQLAELKAAGDEEGLARLQREIALTQELARIQALNLPQPTKDQLAADATYRSGLSASTADPKKTAQEIAAINASMASRRTASLPAQERYFEAFDAQQKVFERMDQIGGKGWEKSMTGLQSLVDTLQTQGGTPENQLAALKLLQEAVDLQDQMTEALKESNEERDREQQLIDRNLQARQKARIDEFIATSRAAAAPSMARTMAAQQSMTLPITESRQRSAIYHTGRKIGIGGGLNQHYLNQRSANQWEMLQRSPSAWQTLQNGGGQFWALQRGGNHLDTGLSGNSRISTLASSASHLSSGLAGQRSLGSQHAANAADPPRPASMEDALQKILTLLPKGIATALLGS